MLTAVVVLVMCGVLTAVLHPSVMSHSSVAGAKAAARIITQPAVDAHVPAVSASALAALPAVRYDAVIAGLMPYTGSAAAVTGSFRIATDVPVFGSDKRTPVARLTAKDFLGAPTTIVVAGSSGPFSLVLTSARVSLPSQTGGNAPAQSAGWVQTSVLHRVGDLSERIAVSMGAQTLSILRGSATIASFRVGVGTPGTPTPTGVTGYLQARYLDPRQGETVYPIQLTSLHSAAADEPYGGNDGGLIGVHYNAVNSGAISHGCIRLPEAAIQAVDQLPLGTPVTITN